MPNRAKTTRKSTTYLIEGLEGESVKELERHWRDARPSGHSIRVSLANLDNISDAGRTLLTYMFSYGAELVVGKIQESEVLERSEGWLEIPALG